MGSLNSSRSSLSGRTRIRWVTWWPVAYWTDRFNYMATRRDVSFEAVFLAGGSKILESTINESAWKFQCKFIRRGTDSTGYYRPKLRLPRPWPIVRGRFDAVVMTYSEASCVAAALLCWILVKPYFLFVANTNYDERSLGKIKEWVKKQLFKGANRVLATGPLQREYASRYVEDEKISIIGNPVGSLEPERYTSPEVRDDLRRAFDWDNEIVLMYVGRLAPEKGLLALLDALGESYSHGTKPKLALVGSGPLEGELRARASDLSLKVEYTGFLQREDLAKRYAAADIFVLPSSSEPWGLVANEAMEFGLPLILSDKVGSAPVLLEDGRNGLIFAAGDIGNLASSVEVLCADSELRERMGEVSRQKIKNHTLEAWAESVLAAVRQDHKRPQHSRI